MDSCVFCKIVAGEFPAYVVWEDEQYLAILDIFPKIRGQVVVIPKQHKDSYVFRLNEDEAGDFFAAAMKVARHMDSVLKTERTAMRMEGLEVNHAHFKLYPVYSTDEYMALVNKAPSRMADEQLRVIYEQFRKEGDI